MPALPTQPQPAASQPLKPSLLPRLLRRLRGALPRTPAGKPGGLPAQAQDPLQNAGMLLRQARESQGLGLRQLAQETRISTPVLEALERGWRDRLPEAAYLRTMLPLLEHRLQLSAGSLDGALPSTRMAGLSGHRSEPLLLRFTPGSIDVFTTWQGTLLYGLLTLGLIYALNLQQRQLSREGLLSSVPIAPLDARSDSQLRPEISLLSTYPELTPLQRAARGQALGRLQRETQTPQTDLSLGQLSLQLAAASRVVIQSERGGITTLRQVSGALSLPVLPPFQLRIEPAPASASAVRWNGQPLPAGKGQAEAGSFRYPSPR